MSHQSTNHQNDYSNKPNKKKFWKRKNTSAQKQDKQNNIAISNPQMLLLANEEAGKNKKRVSESNVSKEPFMLDPANARTLHLNLNTWEKNMEIHIGVLFDELSVEILKDQNGNRNPFPMPEQPDEPDLNTGTAAEKNFASEKYLTLLKIYMDEVKDLKKKKLKIIAELRKYVVTKIDEDIVKANPNYAINPDVIAVLNTIETSYHLLSVGGNSQQLQQLVESRDTNMFNGMAAIENAKRHQGKFDLHEHKEEFQQIEQDRKLCKLPAREPQEQARRFILSLIHIARFRLMVHNFMENEAEYDSMPKRTPDEIAEATKFRKMPKDVSAAYRRASEQVDLHITFNDPVLKPISGASFANYSADGQSNRGANKKGKGKGKPSQVNNNKETDNNKSGNTKPESGKFCVFHQCTTHSTAECNSLPQIALMWNQKQINSRSSNKKTNYKGNDKGLSDNNEDDTSKAIRKSNVSCYTKEDYYNSDDEYPIQRMTLLQKVQQMGCRFARFDAIIDNACSSSLITLNDKKLVSNVRTCTNAPIISTSNGDKKSEGLIGDSHCFGPVYIEDQDVSILPQSLLEALYHLDIVQANGFTLYYDLYIEPYDLVLRFNRMQDGIYVANLGCLVGRDFIINPPKRRFPRELCYQTALAVDSSDLYTSEPVDARPVVKRAKQSVISNKDLKLFEYSQNVVQPMLGFISAADYESSVNNNIFINAPVPPNALRRADQYFGPSMPYIKGKSTKKHRKSHFKEEIQALQDNEVFHQMDLVYLNELVFLFSTIYPSLYCILSYLGYGKGTRVASNILPHLQHHYATYTSLGVKVKISTSDGEGAIAILSTEINKLGIRYEKLSKGQHAIFVDVMIKKWKNSVRCMFHMGMPMIRALRIGAAMNAMWWMNRTCNTSNPNKDSPHHYLTKERLDCSKIQFKFGDLVEAKVEDDIQHNSVNNARSYTGIVLHPYSSPGTYKIYNIQTGKVTARMDMVQIRMIPDILAMLKAIEEEENKKLVTQPEKTVVAAVQHKRITDYRLLYLPHQVAQYGVLPSAVAITDELRGMFERFGSFIPVYIHELTKEDLDELLKSRGMLSIKPDKEGIDNLKGRFLVKGDTQDRSKFKFEDLNSPTVSMTTVMQVLVTGAKEKLLIVLVDHPQAFLKANQKKLQYVKMDKYIAGLFVILYPQFRDYLLPDGCLIIKLLKAIYGQIDAPMLFYKYLAKKLEEEGHYVNPIDRGLFKKVYDDVTDGTYNIVETCTHVDDTLSIVHPSLCERLKSEFKAKYGDDLKVNDDQQNLKFLGMKISVHHDTGTIHISPEIYFNKLCDENADLINGRVRKYPCKMDIFEVDPDSPKLSDRKLAERISTIIYQCGYAQFMAPEISVAITVLKASVNQVTQQVYDRTVYLLQYINGRRDLPLILGPNAKGEYDFTVFADASFNPVKNDSIFLKGCKSVSACVTTLGRGATHVKVAKQSFVANSSTYAELGAANDAIIPASHQQQVLESRGLSGKGIKPGKFKEDNTSTIQLIKNGRSLNAKTKHIKLKYYFIKQYFDNGEFELEYCPTDEMVADILTKPMQGKLFFKLRALLLGHTPMV